MFQNLNDCKYYSSNLTINNNTVIHNYHHSDYSYGRCSTMLVEFYNDNVKSLTSSIQQNSENYQYLLVSQ